MGFEPLGNVVGVDLLQHLLLLALDTQAVGPRDPTLARVGEVPPDALKKFDGVYWRNLFGSRVGKTPCPCGSSV